MGDWPRWKASITVVPAILAVAFGACDLNPHPLPPEKGGEFGGSSGNGPIGSVEDASSPNTTSGSSTSGAGSETGSSSGSGTSASSSGSGTTSGSTGSGSALANGADAGGEPTDATVVPETSADASTLVDCGCVTDGGRGDAEATSDANANPDSALDGGRDSGDSDVAGDAETD